jgi:alpha-tubulin suppressor-like RCC1 family protein
MSYTGIGATDPNHPLEVEGQVFISNVEAGSASQDVPFEVYSDYTGNSGLTDSRQLRLRVTPSATTTTNVHVDMGINNTDGDYFFISEPVTGATTVGTKSTFTINQDGNVGVGSNLSVTGNVVTSNIVGGSPLTISTGSNVQILTSNVGIGTVVDPVSNTRVHIQGGAHASITNANVFPKFNFRSSSNVNQISQGGCDPGLNGKQTMYPSEDGKLWATGDNASGVLGLGDTTDRNVFTLVSSLDGVANIVAASTGGNDDGGYGTSRAIDDNGGLWTWGRNNLYQLGHGDTKDRYIPTKVTLGSITDVNVIEAGDSRAAMIALDSTGQLWGCGYGTSYRAGFGTANRTEFQETTPAESPGYTPSFIAVAGGYVVSLALDSTGNVWSTGQNTDGATGQGTTAGDTAGFYQVDNTNGIESVDIVQITSGGTGGGRSASWALDSNGAMWNTGQNEFGQLGHGNTTDLDKFTKVTTGDVASATIIKVCYMYYSTIALDDQGTMWGCGRNYIGQFGMPPYVNTISSFFPITAGPIADKSVTDIARVGDGVHAMTSDGELWATGYNGLGALGTGDAVDRYTFTKILDFNTNPPPDYGYTRSLLLENTETGKGPSIELKNSDAVSSRIQMEDGASGKLNIGFVDASFDPKLSGGDGAVLEPFQERAQSNAMTRGVTINQAGGTMVAGGSTSNIGFNTPIVNSGLLGTAQYGYGGSYWVSGGTNFVTTEGKVYFAGQNGDGQAGDGTTDVKYEWIESTPLSSYPIVGWAQGTDFAQALDSAGQLWAAGENTFGKLGVGDTTDRETWTANTSIGITHAISCGFSHSLRLAADGTIQACGSGNANRLGVGAGDTSDYYYFKASASGAMSGQTAKSVWAETAGSFAVRSDNALLFVGYNVEGQGGVGSATSPVTTWTLCDTTIYGSETPVQVSCCFDGTDDHFSMMITAEGNIYGTGSGQYNKTGLNNSEADVNKFTQCTGDVRNVTVTRVATTYNASICLDSTGNVWITGRSVVNGNPSNDDNAEFTKITEPAEFYSKTIVNVFGGTADTFYAVDSEGTMWGVGQRIRGLGLSGASGYDSKLFTKVPIYDIVPKEFKYTPTLTLENPNPDYGATVEFKNPNNRAFINLDDKTSTLRLGFVDNENNAGQFKGIGISPSDNSVYFNQGLNLVAPGDEGINFRVPTASIDSFRSISKFIGIRDSNGTKMAGIDFTGENDGQKISFYTHDSGVSIGTRMTIADNGNVGIGTSNPENGLHIYGGHSDFSPDQYGLQMYTVVSNTNGYIEMCGSSSAQQAIDFTNNGSDYRGSLRYSVASNVLYFYIANGLRGYFTNSGQFAAQSFAIYSDKRIKDNITDIDDEASLDIISKLQPKTFYVKNNPGQKRWGFIADEVQELVPEAIESSEEWELPVNKTYPAFWHSPEIVTATIEDATYEVGDKFKFTNNLERYDRNSTFVVKSKTGIDYRFEFLRDRDDKSVQQLGTDTINIRSKMIKDVKVLNREFIDPVMISAMQQMLRKIESLEARVATLENNSA